TGADPANASQGFVTQLPDCTGDPNAGARTRAIWFNPSAFTIPPASAGRYGTCGMNTLEGYPIHVAHVSLAKQFSVTEQVRLVFTAQISNVTNTPHFTIPNNNISTPNPGMFAASSLPANSTPERLGSRQTELKPRPAWQSSSTRGRLSLAAQRLQRVHFHRPPPPPNRRPHPPPNPRPQPPLPTFRGWNL